MARVILTVSLYGNVLHALTELPVILEFFHSLAIAMGSKCTTCSSLIVTIILDVSLDGNIRRLLTKQQLQQSSEIYKIFA